MPKYEKGGLSSAKAQHQENRNDLTFTTTWYQGLSLKFILVIVLLLCSLMSVFAYLNYQDTVEKLNTELRAKGESLARLASFAVVEAVLAFDTEEMEKPILYLNKEPDVAYAVIYSAKNENLTNFVDSTKPVIKKAVNAIGKKDIVSIVNFFEDSQKIEHIKYPVVYKEFNLGYINIGMNRDSVMVESAAVLYKQRKEIIFLILILAITIYYIFNISTIDPIRRLIEGLRKVSMGNLDSHVAIKNKNEIGQLAQSFNIMVDELRQVHKEKDEALMLLENLNNDLALDVEARSYALTEKKKELEYVAMHDSLTNLPNRDSFLDEVAVAIERAKRNKSTFGLVMMDLDSFKEINETKGHDIGDEILIAIATRLEKTIRGNDCVGRLGGDEFVVLIDNVSEKYLQRVAEKLINVIQPAVMIFEKEYFITASMGLALYPAHALTPTELLRCSDIAMYKSKERKDEYTVYDSQLEIKKLRHVDLLGGLRVAIQSDQLFLEYQPKININKGVVSGVEALVRWRHPERGVIPPFEFISLAENTGLIKPLTAWVLDEAIKQNAIWSEQGLLLSVSVNLSMLNLEDKILPEYIGSLLYQYQLPAKQLILEITETMIMANPVSALDTLSKLHAMGIHLSIDDFGTGYSSLAYLHKLPVDEIKIDRSFVLLLTNEDMNKSIVHSIIELGHNLSLSVVAEGVEDVETVLTLAKLHCDIIQGFYFSKPLSADDLDQFCSKPIVHDCLQQSHSN